uniref:MAM domain-containing glycosylphosphatidylinositol anchor protein 1 n=2 Tax=Lygus hesperus TaxID=30085 RepID=A0A0A9Y2N5_LYGHE
MNGNDCLLLLFYLLIAVNISPYSCLPRRNNRCTSIPVPNGKMTVRHRGRVGRFFCNTGYKLIGDKIATCHGGVWDTVPHCVKDIECPQQMPKVMNGKMVPFNYVFFKVVCNPGFMVPHEIQSIFPCEDFFNPDMKPPVCQLTDEQFCDFETDMCKWNNTVPYFSWIRYQNATPSHSLRTGPEGDHTYGTGHYLYIEASGLPSNEERFAKLVRRFWKVDTPEVCFVFWYHMYGFSIGTLDVYVDYVKVFTKTGNLGDKWRKGIVQNLPSDRDFYISMVATTGNGYAGDIAIDDIGLVNSTDCTKIFLIETSCKDRCFEVETNSTLCKCSSECLIEANCCPDFMQTCGAGRYTFSAVKSESKTTTYISLAVGILIFLSAAFFAGYVFRRRRSHLFRGSTEESDVLYMTSDEILDFNVARRPTASGTTAASSSQQILCQTEY